jgi:ABC-2 type transport system ATP-binding protein
MDAIATYGLTKYYRAHAALRGLDLRVPTGRLFGFLGPNGAGKTTALRLLLGLLRATSGRAEVLGRDAWRDGPVLRAEVGYLPGDVRFWSRRTGRQTLAFLDAARGRRGQSELPRLTERFELDLGRKVRDYSRGMKQKLGLIAALMHRPQLLILDEPTVSLDPLMRETLYAELRAVVAEGRTVVFSSHTLAESCSIATTSRSCATAGSSSERIVVLRDGVAARRAAAATGAPGGASARWAARRAPLGGPTQRDLERSDRATGELAGSLPCAGCHDRAAGPGGLVPGVLRRPGGGAVMSRAVLLKTLRDGGMLSLLLVLGVVGLEMAVIRALLEISKDLEDLRRWMCWCDLFDCARRRWAISRRRRSHLRAGHPAVPCRGRCSDHRDGAIAGRWTRDDHLLLTFPFRARSLPLFAVWLLGPMISFALLGWWENA